MESSTRMRESLFVARERTKNSLESQQELTEHTLRKRIFDTQRARNEFEWQIIKVSSIFFPFFPPHSFGLHCLYICFPHHETNRSAESTD